MKSLFSNVVAYVQGHMRLLYGYALIAALITLGGFTATLWLRNAQLKTDVANLNTDLVTTQATVTQLEFTAEVQHRTIQELADLRKRDSVAVEGLASDVKSISARDTKSRQKIQDLEKQNEIVRNYLDSPIPADLVCLLNRTPCTETGPGGKGNPAHTAQSSGDRVPARK